MAVSATTPARTYYHSRTKTIVLPAAGTTNVEVAGISATAASRERLPNHSRDLCLASMDVTCMQPPPPSHTHTALVLQRPPALRSRRGSHAAQFLILKRASYLKRGARASISLHQVAGALFPRQHVCDPQ